jgi:hypothetical protein
MNHSTTNNNFIYDNQNLQELFHSYKIASSRYIKSSITYTSQEILAINNILYLEKTIDTSDLMIEHIPTSILTALRVQQSSIYSNIDIKFPSTVKEEIEDVLNRMIKTLWLPERH